MCSFSSPSLRRIITWRVELETGGGINPRLLSSASWVIIISQTVVKAFLMLVPGFILCSKEKKKKRYKEKNEHNYLQLASHGKSHLLFRLHLQQQYNLTDLQTSLQKNINSCIHSSVLNVSQSKEFLKHFQCILILPS